MRFARFLESAGDALRLEQPMDGADGVVELVIRDNQVFISLDENGETCTLSAPIGAYEHLDTERLNKLARHNVYAGHADDFTVGGFHDVGFYTLSKRFVLSDAMAEGFSADLLKLPGLLDRWRDWFVASVADGRLAPPRLAALGPLQREGLEGRQDGGRSVAETRKARAASLIDIVDRLASGAGVNIFAPYTNVRILSLSGCPVTFVADEGGMVTSAERQVEFSSGDETSDPVTHSIGQNFLLSGTLAQSVWPASTGSLVASWFLPAATIDEKTVETVLTAIISDTGIAAHVLQGDESAHGEMEPLLEVGVIRP